MQLIDIYKDGDEIHWRKPDNKDDTDGVVVGRRRQKLMVRIYRAGENTEKIDFVDPTEYPVGFGFAIRDRWFGRKTKDPNARSKAVGEMGNSPWTDYHR